MQLIGQMHTAGFHHGAMYPRNILMQLLASVNYSPHIIDTPKSLVYYKDLHGDPLATIDLQHFLYSLRDQLPVEQMVTALNVYGMQGKKAVELAKQIHTQPKPTRHTRNNQRTYARFRSLFVKPDNSI